MVTQEELDTYLDGVIQDIQTAREDPDQWKLNEEYHAQLELGLKTKS